MNLPLSSRAGDRLPSRGFTLVEILVVISIIALLAVLTMSVVSSMQKRGRAVAAANNMRQLGAACVSFASENNGVLPGPCGLALYKGYTKNTKDQLSVYIGPYLGLPAPASLADGQSVIVPQLVDPGFVAWNAVHGASSSVPQYFQRPGLPAPFQDSTLPNPSSSTRRPLGRTDGPTSVQAPLSIVSFNDFTTDANKWYITSADQQVAGTTSGPSYFKNLPPTPVHGKRFRLYIDGHVAPLDNAKAN